MNDGWRLCNIFWGLGALGIYMSFFKVIWVWQSRLVVYSRMVGQLCNRSQIRYLASDLYMHPVMFIQKNLEGTEDSLKGRAAELLR